MEEDNIGSTRFYAKVNCRLIDISEKRKKPGSQLQFLIAMFGSD